MTLRDSFLSLEGFGFVIERLAICSSLAREALFEREFSSNKDVLQKSYSQINNMIEALKDKDKKETLGKISLLLKDIRDIRGSINLIQRGEVLDDISLFEIKVFGINAQKIFLLVKDIEEIDYEFIDLEELINLLDPEQLRLNQFYIYSSYSKVLLDKRKELEKAKRENSDLEGIIFCQCLEIENHVREALSKKIEKYHSLLSKSIEIIAQLDIALACADYFSKEGYCCPQITDEDKIEYRSLFYPLTKEKLNANGKCFQPIDIKLSLAPTLISGANMGGKTLLLKSLSLSQLLAQYGLFVPCQEAKISLVEDVLISIGDNQNEQEGLSSFASEMLQLNSIIQKAKTQKRYLILVDELARSTNPQEGLAIVNSFIDIIGSSQSNSFSAITTHYWGIKANCNKLRIRGFEAKDAPSESINISNITNFMDYSLTCNTSDSVNRDALTIATILGIDNDLIQSAKNFLEQEKE